MYKILLIFLTFSLPLLAEKSSSFTPNYHYENININYLDWSQETQSLESKDDFAYFGIEGGASWDEGDFYGFFNLENPLNSYSEEAPSDLRYSAFADIDINIKNGFKLHLQNYHLHSQSFYVNDFVVGASYKYKSDFGLWVKPFLGLHFTNSTYFDGFNGMMTGWLFSYSFTLFEQNFNLFQWNEIEFARDTKFYKNEDGSLTGDSAKWGLNGALSAWWLINNTFSTGIQYRYADNKLGSADYQSAFVYTARYHF
jgi:hypothetical protein